MPQNLIEKIVQKYAVNWPKDKEVHAGDYITIRPAYVMTHDNTGAVIPKFYSIGAKKIADPDQVVHTLDHNIQDTSEKNLAKYRKIEEFSRSMGCHFFPAGRGIGHQIMIEEGFAFPGTLAVASDSHSNMYGGAGCLGTPIVRTDAAAIWATGKTWWQVPPVAKVELTGKLPAGVTGKDVIITLAGFFNKDEVLNHGLEFCGEGVKSLTFDHRLSIANMTTEWGALAGIFPIDETTINWLKARSKRLNPAGKPAHPRINMQRIEALQSDMPKADAGAFYAKTIQLDLGSVRPHVSGPNSVKVMTAVSEIRKQNIKIDKAYLVSCVNSRQEDIAEAAAIMKGKKVAPGVKFYIAAASSEVQADSEKSGDWQALLDAGAIPLPPGCGPCIGLGAGLLEDGEVGISATNRNFKGRMGSPNAQAYLASPAVVAASAISGKIDLPYEMDDRKPVGNITVNEQSPVEKTILEIIDGFPGLISGALIFCHQDNLNTDGIYPGKYTYLDDITPEKQAEVVMENYDPQFSRLAEKGDILVGGFNFGTGSSREQAATALKYKGIQAVIAGSFSETYKRNAINNGFLIIESPELVNDLKSRFGTSQLTVKTNITIVIDFKNSIITADGKKYPFGAVGRAAQEIIVAGGLENWVKIQM
ncbi:MAG: homoaconitase [Calditrichaceae bacterium]|nr:homoaconitase [Calditrichaceae bacterium]MBN2709761.1 homoaconitase [Calditrichaceae bacterium]RQV94955.1 MAG: homoaconitase [Calditrichota bacterium]